MQMQSTTDRKTLVLVRKLLRDLLKHYQNMGEYVEKDKTDGNVNWFFKGKEAGIREAIGIVTRELSANEGKP